MTYRLGFCNALEGAAEWRRECAERYPDDAERNIDAAKSLESLESQFRAGDYDQGLMRRYAALAEDESVSYDLVETQREIIGRIGFHEFPKTPDDILDSILTRVRAFAGERAA